MSRLTNKQIRTGALLCAALFLLIAMVLVVHQYDEGSKTPSSGDSRLAFAETDGDSWRNGIHDRTRGFSLTPVLEIDPNIESDVLKVENGPEKDLLTANGLAIELKRIVRAGKSMETLRSSSDRAQVRRCFEGMEKLRNRALSIHSRRRNIVIPSEASISLNDVMKNVIKCISCDGDARKACDLAQVQLGTIV